MLSHEETLALIKQAQLGDDNAKEKLIKENMPLIKSIVKRFKGRLEYDDLMQLGAMGFTKAMMGFDDTYSVRFSTFYCNHYKVFPKRLQDKKLPISRELFISLS